MIFVCLNKVSSILIIQVITTTLQKVCPPMQYARINGCSESQKRSISKKPHCLMAMGVSFQYFIEKVDISIGRKILHKLINLQFTYHTVVRINGLLVWG